MAIIVVACGSVVALVLRSGQPLERTSGILLFLAGLVLLGWLGLSNARRRQQQTGTLLKTAGSPSAPKWRFGLSALLIVLGILVFVTSPRKVTGYIFVGVGLAGLLGFNVFRGGPLDKRRPNP